MLYLKSNVHIKVDCKFVVIMHYAFHIILIIGKGLVASVAGPFLLVLSNCKIQKPRYY